MSATLPGLLKGKPRLPFCWRCSRKLHGNAHRVVVIDGHERIVHAQCIGRFIENDPEAETRPDLCLLDKEKP